ncbi:MAG: hypothetical protein F6K39_37125 [Okeania sp. SIO3B3]|nr:hypothetical protein [Okeania sp. SIO3B3]
MHPPKNLPTDQDTENIIWRNQAKVSNYLADILDKMVREYFREHYKNATEVLEALNIQASPQPTPVPTTLPTIPSIPKKAKPTLSSQPTEVPIISPISKTPTQFEKSRRQILILGGLAGSGFVAAMLTKDLSDKSSSENISTSEPTEETSVLLNLPKLTHTRSHELWQLSSCFPRSCCANTEDH